MEKLKDLNVDEFVKNIEERLKAHENLLQEGTNKMIAKAKEVLGIEEDLNAEKLTQILKDLNEQKDFATLQKITSVIL